MKAPRDKIPYRGLKVLPLPFWAQGNNRITERMYLDCVGGPYPVVIGRPGMYYDRYKKVVWVEGPRGSHKLEDNRSFLYELSMLQHTPFTGSERRSMMKVLSSGKLPRRLQKDLRSLLHHDEEWHQLRATSRNTRAWALRLRKEFKLQKD